MALPRAFATAEEFFASCLDFFKKYQIFYNFPNTDVLVLNILDEIPLEKSNSAGDLHEFLKSILEGRDILPDFFDSLKRLQFDFEDFSKGESVKKKYYATMSEKKIHEVNNLAKEVDDVCKTAECKTVIDFGSGLGYVDEILFTEYNYKVLGIECSEEHIKRAEIRRQKCCNHSSDHVKFLKHRISENSHGFLNEYLNNNFKDAKSLCITGLHACADLGATTLDLFLKMAAVKCMVLMPCCYHKMNIINERFESFPKSKSLLGVFDRYEGHKFMGTPFLRLAAHPANRTEKLEDGVFNLLSRAILQLYAHRHKFKLKRAKRKAVKTKTAKEFDSYIKEAITGYKIVIENEPYSDRTEESISFDIDEIRGIWREHFDSSTFRKAAIFLMIQNCLQPVIENLILFDRIMFLKENGVQNCYFKEIFDKKLSPRCLALVAFK